MRDAHDAYFSQLDAALRRAGLTRPTLVIDRARLQGNIEAVRRTLDGTGIATRIVVKSLPCRDLVDVVSKGVGTRRLMVFNGPMLKACATLWPDADLLLGKPLPAAEAAQVLDAIGPAAAPQWLIDTRERMAQYAELARARGLAMRVSLEIDIGLHRGGFATAEAVAGAVDAAQQAGLTVSGLMGYDPHIPRMPNPSQAFARSQKLYADAKAAVRARLGAAADRLDWNTAGSPTYALHAKGSEGSEVAIGSAFVKPTDFDLDTLAHHQPAAFIATPVIKAFSRSVSPGGIFALLEPEVMQAYFIHGGHWLAKPESPPGLQYGSRFGRSSNQELLTSPAATGLSPDDTVFFRPTQSEAVFLQFGDIAVFADGEIKEMWPTFPVSA